MHKIIAKSILSANNGMNLYRGCTHGCIYCDSRSNKYNMNHSFNDIEVKSNAISLLRKELHNRKEACMIGTGSMTDPYIPLEKELQYTRKSMQLVYEYGYGFTCITKSDLVLRDIDLLEKINNKTKAVVQMTLTCMDDKTSRIIEPNVCPTTRRIEVLEKLSERNIPTVVWLCPILPYITDTPENINGIIDACIRANVKGIICFGMGLTLRDKNREYYYKKLDQHYPELKKKYIKQYKNSYHIESPRNLELMKLFKEKTSKAGILNKPEEIFKYLHTFPINDKTVQTKLF